MIKTVGSSLIIIAFLLIDWWLLPHLSSRLNVSLAKMKYLLVMMASWYVDSFEYLLVAWTGWGALTSCVWAPFWTEFLKNEIQVRSRNWFYKVMKFGRDNLNPIIAYLFFTNPNLTNQKWKRVLLLRCKFLNLLLCALSLQVKSIIARGKGWLIDSLFGSFIDSCIFL